MVAGILLLAGVYVSSMSSCLGAMYGTPRVLQSIANEKVIPVIGFLGQGVSTTFDSFMKIFKKSDLSSFIIFLIERS